MFAKVRMILKSFLFNNNNNEMTFSNQSIDLYYQDQ